MNKYEFEKFVRALVTYFGKDNFLLNKNKEDRLRVWFGAVENIPPESLSWITRQIQEDYDTLPTNVPKAMKHYFSIWLEKHPDKRSTIYSTNSTAHQQCPHCFGGLLEFKKQSRGQMANGRRYYYRVVARCGHCRSRTEPMIPMMSVSDGEARGWRHVRPDPGAKPAGGKAAAPPAPPQGYDMAALTENIGV